MFTGRHSLHVSRPVPGSQRETPPDIHVSRPVAGSRRETPPDIHVSRPVPGSQREAPPVLSVAVCKLHLVGLLHCYMIIHPNSEGGARAIDLRMMMIVIQLCYIRLSGASGCIFKIHQRPLENEGWGWRPPCHPGRDFSIL